MGTPGRKKQDRFCAEPTPEELLEIEERKKEVQSWWSEKEQEARFTGPKREGWSIPCFTYDSDTGIFQREKK